MPHSFLSFFNNVHSQFWSSPTSLAWSRLILSHFLAGALRGLRCLQPTILSDSLSFSPLQGRLFLSHFIFHDFTAHLPSNSHYSDTRLVSLSSPTLQMVERSSSFPIKLSFQIDCIHLSCDNPTTLRKWPTENARNFNPLAKYHNVS